MRWPILFGILLFSILLGAGNNLINPHRISWSGSAEVLPKPEGWPNLTIGEGVAGGLKFARHEAVRNWALVTASLLLLAALIRIGNRRGGSASRGAISWLRIALALMFLAAAYPKFSDPKAFSMLVTQYQFLPAFSVNVFSLGLPAFEIVTGLALLFTPFEKESSAALLLLLLMFIVALAQAFSRGLGIACGCFDIEGIADAGETWFSLLRDLVLLIPAAWMWFKAERRYFWQL